VQRYLEKWISFQQHRKVLFYAILTTILAFGVSVAVKSEIQAFPELTNVQVQVITQFPGKAAEEVERQITVPLEVATNGISGLINQRSVSLFGLSVITLTFDDSIQLKQARLNVFQRLSDVDLPEGVKPGLSPESTPLGEIFRYTLRGDLPVDELRMIEDWTLEREFKSIPGVADVVSFGGPLRTIEVRLNIPKMKALNLDVSDVAQFLGQNQANAGGSFINHGEEAYIVRSLGLYESPESLEAAVVGTHDNVPIRIRDIGSVELSHRLRLGQVGRNDEDDVVEGIILLRQGSDTLETIHQVKEKIDALNHGILPASVEIVPLYDRTQLIHRASHTVFHNIIFGIVLVALLLILGLGFRYWPLTVGVAVIIPFALLMAFLGMKLLGYTPNLISLGAVDFGIIVETAIFSAEAVILGLVEKGRRDVGVVSEALSEVLAPALLCALLLMIAFIPILSLQRVEGRIFKPLGITLVSALIGGQIGALLFIPIFAFLTPAGEHKASTLDRFFNFTLAVCEKIARTLSKIPKPGWVFAAVFFLLLGVLNHGLGREFLPQLNEGSLYIRASAPRTVSRETAVQLAATIRDRLKKIPEVLDVVSQIGRPDDGTDINGFDNVEFLVVLDEPDHWKSASTIDGLSREAQDLLKDIDGVDFNFSQPIKDNVDEAISGVKGELVVKLFGTKLDELQKYANQVTGILEKVPGAQDVGSENLLGQPELRFKIDREGLARYGLRVTSAEEVLENALLGKFSTRMIDEQGRFVDVLVKPQMPDQPDKNSLSALPVLTGEGGNIPLGSVASVQLAEGVNRIYREQGQRRIAVKCSVRGRAVVDFVNEARRRIDQEVKLPSKYHMEWSGSFENAQRAGKQLMIVVPLCVLAMIIILQTWFGNWKDVGLLIWEVPFSFVGGLAALRLMGLNLSISAAAGAIVLIGVSFLTGMMLISEWLHTRSVWTALRHEGRGILLSSGVAIVGLIPAAFSHGIGAETAKPFAVIILGGLVTSLFFSLTVLPALLALQDQRRGHIPSH